MQISASFTSSEDRVRALEGGADAYLTHPIDRMVLLATVRALLRLRNAEAVARSAADQWEATFNSLSEGLALVDSEGRLMRWNDAFANICSSKATLAVGHDVAACMVHLIGTAEPLDVSNEQRFQGEFALENRTVQLSVNKIGTQSDHGHKILILSDITDRKVAEYALRTAEKLSATGKLANAIAHEINNPLEAVTNLIYLASEARDSDSISRYLQSANEQLNRISRITKQTLAFHRDTQSAVSVDVGRLVSDVVTLYDRSVSANRIRLVCDIKPSEPISGFPGQLTQVFGNLIRNASEAAPPDSEVIVRVRSIQRGGSGGVRVTIRDRGRGIPEPIRQKMFDPFFTTKELKGSGLGLWVSKNLIANHGGTIRFRSSEREGSSGTVFEVYLPYPEPVESA